MICCLCQGAIRFGQLFVSCKAYVGVRDAHGSPTYEPMVLENGAAEAVAHYGCLLKRAPPELLGISWGEPDLGEPSVLRYDPAS